MGLLSGLLGNASEVDTRGIESELEMILTENEQIQKAFKLIRDLFVFTDKRLILVDKQGVTGKKVEYHSIPYKSITHYSVESAGHLDLEAELKVWISGMHEPITKEFKKDKNIFEVQRALAKYVNK
ncbi:MAG: PH domain-containing protein [Bacillota bacterium]|nr:PH domain-containing protein [Bacillota bacterium]